MTRAFTENEIAGLIEKLKAARGPDCKLDGAIWQITDPDGFDRQCSFRGKWYAGHNHTLKEKREHIARMAEYYAPAFTASIDAALTLVPEGMFWFAAFGREREDEPLCGASIVKPDDTLNPIGEAESPTVPLAIVIAALKARASIGEA